MDQFPLIVGWQNPGADGWKGNTSACLKRLTLPMTSPAQRCTDLIIRKLGGTDRFSDAERRAIDGLPVTVRTIAPQQDIMHEGGPSSSCCILLEGWTCCYQLLDEGRRQILSVHVPGDMPDLQGLHLPNVDFGMATLTPAVVAFVPHADLRRVAADFSSISTALWHEALIMAAIHRAWIVGLGRRDARGRLAHLLCELYLRLDAVDLVTGTTVPMPLRQNDFADALGVTPVHVNRTLKELREEGLIHLRARTLEIRDWASLRAAGEFRPHYLHLAA